MKVYFKVKCYKAILEILCFYFSHSRIFAICYPPKKISLVSHVSFEGSQECSDANILLLQGDPY